MKDYAEWFYKSTAWKRNREAFLTSRFHICERCKNKDGIGNIAHHKTYITPDNIFDESITMNWDNLECLCQTCHNKEHHKGEESVTAEGLMFDIYGQLVRKP